MSTFPRNRTRVPSVRAAHGGLIQGFWKTTTRSHCASAQGNVQFNVYKLTSIELLTDAFRSFCDLCTIGIESNKNASENISVIVDVADRPESTYRL